MEPMWKRALGTAALVFAGVVVAVVGSVAYRSVGYLGLVLSLLLVASVGLFSKAWHAWWGFTAYAAAWAVTAFLFAQPGPGGSVLVPDSDIRAAVWIYGGAGVMAVIGAIPPFVLAGKNVAS